MCSVGEAYSRYENKQHIFILPMNNENMSLELSTPVNQGVKRFTDFVVISTAGQVPLRETPNDTSALRSQALYGEVLGIVESSGSWVKGFIIPNPKEWKYGNHETFRQGGWFELHHAQNRLTAEKILSSLHLPRIIEPTEIFDSKGNKIKLPSGSRAHINNPTSPYPLSLTTENLMTVIQNDLGSSYLWGARGFDADCSGAMDRIFRRFGIDLPHSSKKIALLGRKVADLSILKRRKDLSELVKTGDLVFFGNPINHVGIVTENLELQLVHARQIFRAEKLNWASGTKLVPAAVKLITRIAHFR
jgi:cell wall-associated NlpC family hydrolase